MGSASGGGERRCPAATLRNPLLVHGHHGLCPALPTFPPESCSSWGSWGSTRGLTAVSTQVWGVLVPPPPPPGLLRSSGPGAGV